jgi:hypothetical protein
VLKEIRVFKDMWSTTSIPQIGIQKNGKKVFIPPMKFQLPLARCVYGLSEYNSISLRVSPEFTSFYRTIEQTIGIIEPWNSALVNDIIRFKIDESTWIFNKNGELEPIQNIQNAYQDEFIRCIIEIQGTYTYKGKSGLVIKCLQFMHDECEFIEDV